MNEYAIKINEFIQKNVGIAYKDKQNLVLIIESYLFLIDYYLILQTNNVKERQVLLNSALHYAKSLGKYSFWRLKVFERAAKFYKEKDDEYRKNYFLCEANKIRANIYGEGLDIKLREKKVFEKK